MGNPCTKFVVPSTGSTIQVGASVTAAMDPASALDSCAAESQSEVPVRPHRQRGTVEYTICTAVRLAFRGEKLARLRFVLYMVCD